MSRQTAWNWLLSWVRRAYFDDGLGQGVEGLAVRRLLLQGAEAVEHRPDAGQGDLVAQPDQLAGLH